MAEHELPMGGCSRASDHYAHLARGESRCENEWAYAPVTREEEP